MKDLINSDTTYHSKCNYSVFIKNITPGFTKNSGQMFQSIDCKIYTAHRKLHKKVKQLIHKHNKA